MPLNLKALASAGAIFVGGSLCLVGLINLAAPTYGTAVLALAAAVYPGYHGPAGIASVLVVTLYGLVDGAVGGALVGWLYNRFAQVA